MTDIIVDDAEDEDLTEECDCGTTIVDNGGDPTGEHCDHHTGECLDCCLCWYCGSCDNRYDPVDAPQCDSCDYCGSCCHCWYCISCEAKYSPDSDYYCTDCEKCHDCGCSCDEDSPSTPMKNNGRGGVIQTVAWNDQEDLVKFAIEISQRGCDYWKEVYPLAARSEEIPVSEWQADFYLCQAMKAGEWTGGVPQLRPATVIYDAEEYLDALIDEMDATFRQYLDLAVGGELRHHGAASRGGIVGERPEAWGAWYHIRRKIGLVALEAAVALFEDFTSEGYGGPKWAEIAKCLLMRENGDFPPEVFCDRVFNLQHNGGVVLNKLCWADNPTTGYASLDAIKIVLGPAHSHHPPRYDVLYSFASPRVRELVDDYWDKLEARAKQYGHPVVGQRPAYDMSSQYFNWRKLPPDVLAALRAQWHQRVPTCPAEDLQREAILRDVNLKHAAYKWDELLDRPIEWFFTQEWTVDNWYVPLQQLVKARWSYPNPNEMYTLQWWCDHWGGNPHTFGKAIVALLESLAEVAPRWVDWQPAPAHDPYAVTNPKAQVKVTYGTSTVAWNVIYTNTTS